MRNNLRLISGALDRQQMASTDTVGPVANAQAQQQMVTESVTVAVQAEAVIQPKSTSSRPNLVTEAKMKGYEGDPCGECGNFTLVRNGTCMKCNTCGGTSGCS